MKTLRRSQAIYEMSASNKPAVEVDAGETVGFLTEDAYSGTIKTARDVYPASMAGRANPATGPVYVRGAKPGDVLAVEILSVEPVGRATMFTGPGKGPLGHKLAEDKTGKFTIRGGFVHFGKRRIPVGAMIGVIGVAPAGEPIGNAWPGEHGGNMDCNCITEGATVYLPVAVDGALLALGDVHAAQAAGEVAICAAETKGEVTARVGIAKEGMITPAVESKRDIFLIASARTLDEAEGMVLDKAFRYLTEIRGMEGHEAVRLLGLVGDLEICQVVDPLKTMRVRLPKRYL